MQLKRSEMLAAALVVAFILAIGGFAVYPSLRQAPRDQCLANLKAVTTSLGLYAGDYGGRYPPAARWSDVLCAKYVDDLKTMVCTEFMATPEQVQRLQNPGGKPLPAGYSLFRPLGGGSSSLVAAPESTPLVFDSAEVRANSVADLGALAFRHTGRAANVEFVDGHGKSLTAAPAVPKPLFKTPEPATAAAASTCSGGAPGHEGGSCSGGDAGVTSSSNAE